MDDLRMRQAAEDVQVERLVECREVGVSEFKRALRGNGRPSVARCSVGRRSVGRRDASSRLQLKQRSRGSADLRASWRYWRCLRC